MTKPPEPPEPRLRPTSGATLFVAALAAAAVAWLLISRFYGDIPRMPYLPAITLFLLAVAEVVTARATKARIDRKPGTQPVEALLVARYVVLAKASSLAGAIFTGAYGALLVFAWARRTEGVSAASDDIPPIALGLAASILLVAAALWLERACRIPEPPEDDEPPPEPD